MGLLNVTHTDMTQSMINLQSDLLKNPFYLFNDKKATPVDYYNVNTSRSTLDESLKISYDVIGKDCSLRFNRIHNFYLYGLDRITMSLENGEYGISAGDISGEAIILPDTITPYVGDRFVINMTNQNYQFYVSSVSSDTFENGGNYWRIEYNIFTNKADCIEELVVNEFNFVSGNVGTNFSPIIQKSKWDVCKILDEASIMMKDLFKGLFFNNKVQTYTFVYLYQVCQTNMNSDFFYDPYMIEFCIRNNLLENSNDDYDFIDHKTALSSDFRIKYSKSIWRVLETKRKEELSSCRHTSNAVYINDPGTIFSTRYENYFELNYSKPDPTLEIFAPSIDIIDSRIIGFILEDQTFPTDNPYSKYNIIVKYFNNEDIGPEDIIPLERIMETDNNKDNYFLIPMFIFIIEYYLKDLMKKTPDR